jgi:5-formyltetrahydrofolate cyclo-ligase
VYDTPDTVCEPPETAKRRLRSRMRQSLRDAGDRRRVGKNQQACRNLIATPQFQDASAIMMYLPLPYEVDPSESILAAWRCGKAVAVPRVSRQEKKMFPVQIRSLKSGFAPDVIGLRNPVIGVPMPVDRIDLVVAPALALDRFGNRLGQGGSYYDKFFADDSLRAIRCGLAFEEQLLDAVPVADWDEAVDMVVTNNSIIYCNHRQRF